MFRGCLREEIRKSTAKSRRMSTSHGRAGATESERQWRAAGDEEQDGREAFPYIL